MQSQLTRQVFSRLLSEKGLVFHCTSCQDYYARSRDQHITFQVIRKCFRRTLFGFSKNIARVPRDPSITPGLPKMIELKNMSRIGARPPPASQLSKSWIKFFAFKLKHMEFINVLQAEYAWQTFKYLKKLNSTLPTEKLTLPNFKLAIKALKYLPDERMEYHLEYHLEYHRYLAKALFNEILEQETDPNEKNKFFENYIHILSLTGETSEAWRVLESRFLEPNKETKEVTCNGVPCDMYKLWKYILKGFAREKNETELLQKFEVAIKNGMVFHPVIHKIMTTFFADKDDVENTKKWYSMPIVSQGDYGPYPRPQTLASVLEFCLRNNELEWCKNIFKEALSLNPSKGTWDVVFLWAAGAMGKGVEDVERMIEIMIRRNPNNEIMRPNIHTINGLINLVISKNNPYLAERYLSLGLKYGIRPNARTLIHQLCYRIDANDLRGARAAYEALQAQEVLKDEDLPSINKYIRSICTGPGADIDLVRSIIKDLDERSKRLEAATVAKLCSLYFDHCEIDGFVDILQTNIYHYTMSERSLIRDAFVKFCCNRYNSSLKAWDAYNILRQFFDETVTEQRTQIMNSFFERRRCDMACHTFGHMRQNNVPSRKPVLGTYVGCLEGIAKLSNREYLDIVHNMLKLDSSIEPNTKLYNALMLAYTAVCEGGRALGFWNDITSGYEGPDYKSLEIVFWACQESNNGSDEARRIYGKLKRMNVEITASVFAEYLGSLSKDAHWFEVKFLVQTMKQEHGLRPDVRTLGTIYNCLPGDEVKSAMEAWSIEHFPEVWTDLRKLGRRVVKHKLYPEIRMRQFYLKREFKA